MLLEDVVIDYVQFCRVEKGLTPKTVKTFGSWGRFYVKWLVSTGHENPALEDFNPVTLKAYLYYLSGLKYRPRTIRTAFTVLKGIGNFLIDKKALTENYASSVKLPKLDAAHRDLVTDDEMRALLAACERQVDPIRVALSRAVISVLAYAALRRQELTDLRIGDVNFKEKCIVVRQGKGMKSRTVYPHPDCLLALREYLAVRPPSQLDWLFLYDKGRRMAYNSLRTLLQQVKAIAGLANHDNIRPHAIRRNAATRILRSGADIRAIQSLLGHSQLETTAIYLSADEERLREISHLGSLRPATTQPYTEQETKGAGKKLSLHRMRRQGSSR